MRWICRLVFSVGLIVLGAGHAHAGSDTAYAVAGVPVDLAKERNYEAIFTLLAQNGVSLFVPVFLYQQVPVARSLGYERDFTPPCKASDPAFVALRKSGLGLIMPASLLYSPDRPLPPKEQDPLAAVIACAGEGVVRGVASYDEPVHARIPEAAVEALYVRVKEIAPQLPVMMVHAPMTTGTSSEYRHHYIEAVRSMSRYSDFVGFDVYPIPERIARIVGPQSGNEVIGGAEAVTAYTDLIRELAPDKKYLTVLQSFAYADQYAPALRETFPPELVAIAARGPTRAELDSMANAARNSGAGLVIWFGGAYTPSAAEERWQATLDATRQSGWQ